MNTIINNLKPNDKFCDLCLLNNDSNIKVHKFVVCNISKYISMLVEKEQEKNTLEWPPIHTLKISLPENLSFDDFIDAINYIYEIDSDKKYSHNTLQFLMFMLVSDELLIKLFQKNTSIRVELSDENKKLLISLLEIIKKKDALIDFYGTEISEYLNISDIDRIIFKKPLSENLIMKKYDIEKNQRVFSKKMGKFEPSIESSWTYFEKVSYSDIKFNAIGIDWVLNRFTVPGFYGGRDDVLHIYVDEKFQPNSILNLRVCIIIFTETIKPRTSFFVINNFNTDTYKLSYMKKNYESNCIAPDVNFIEGNERVRMSILMEKI